MGPRKKCSVFFSLVGKIVLFCLSFSGFVLIVVTLTFIHVRRALSFCANEEKL